MNLGSNARAAVDMVEMSAGAAAEVKRAPDANAASQHRELLL
jgi:hypothetical protein